MSRYPALPAPACLLLVTAVASASFADVAPNSLRVTRTATDVRLTWTEVAPPNAVFRTEQVDRMLAQSSIIATPATSPHDDPSAPLTGVLYFYQVAPPDACSRDADCDAGPPCTSGACVASTCMYTPTDPGIPEELAGVSLADFPYFAFYDAFNEDSGAEVALDPFVHPALAGPPCDVYVVADRDRMDWCTDPTLVDVRGAPDTRSFVFGTIATNRYRLLAPFQVPADAGADIGLGYDVVFDCDQDGRLSPTDLIDGLDDAGFRLFEDLTTPGPHATNCFDEVGPLPPWPGPWPMEGDDLRVCYPAELDDPTFVGTFPLVVVSHGNGHSYDWYRFLQEHLASYGYLAYTHDNNTSPGIQEASLSTLRFTDQLIEEQATLGAGVLDGHIDSSQIVWIGHSRGGEGVARAYDRLVDEAWPAVHYTTDDIKLIASIAPTDFLGAALADPHDKPYSLLYGASDGDVSGCAQFDVVTSFNLFERALGWKSSTYLHGADHNDFNCCGFNDFQGPPATEIGRAEAQQAQKALYLTLVEHRLDGNREAAEFLWRQNEALRPLGVAPTTVIDNDWLQATPAYVLDDFQTNPMPGTSSAGGAVTFDVVAVTEGLLNDGDNRFAASAADPMNGMTRVNTDVNPNDVQAGLVFEFNPGQQSWFLEFEVPAADRDFRGYDALSLRACQRTRHPETTIELADLVFTVTLRDGNSIESTVDVAEYGGGLEEPYQRGGCMGAGAGWQNEFETIRIALGDFVRDGWPLDLSDVAAVRLNFGVNHGAAQGAVGLDDIRLITE